MLAQIKFPHYYTVRNYMITFMQILLKFALKRTGEINLKSAHFEIMSLMKMQANNYYRNLKHNRSIDLME